MLQLFKIKAFLFVITLLLFTSAAFADEPGFGEEGGNDPGAAPISDWIPLMLLVGIALVFYYTHKRKQLQQ